MISYPLIFKPLLKEKVWGGRRLEDFGKDLPDGAKIGESWEIADLGSAIADGQSIIANGPLAGSTLAEKIADHKHQIMGAGKLSADGRFPLLIKFLDAKENLSVQVHPSEDYASRHPEAHLKSEAWIVLEAEPGSVIYKGIKPNITKEQFAQHIQDGSVVDDLIAIPVKAGDCHYLPTGTCHALGGGVLVAEIQTVSDTTFRIYDWQRTDRELHIDQALECIAFGEPLDDPESPVVTMEAAGMRTTDLVKTPFFKVERIEALTDAMLPVITSGLPVVWMMLSGGGRIAPSHASSDSYEVQMPIGTTALMPAELAEAVARLEVGTTLLRVTLPSPMEGLIA